MSTNQTAVCRPYRVAVYVRVSRLDQQPENQLIELRRYVAARGWDAVEFVEHGVSGAKERRPALDAMMTQVRRKAFDALLCWKLDRVGRSMQHLIGLLNDLRALQVDFVSLGEGLDTSTPAGRLIFGIIASVAEFERERLRERTLLGLERARRQGKKLGRPFDAGLRARIKAHDHLGVRAAARALHCSTNSVLRVRRALAQTNDALPSV